MLSGGSFFRYSRNAWLDAIKSTVASIICGVFSPNFAMMIILILSRFVNDRVSLLFMR